MIAIVQLINSGNVAILGSSDTKRDTKKGLIVFLGVSQSDTAVEVERVADKLTKLRIFPDTEKKMNLNVKDVNGEILLIPQFTLLGDVKGNNRPDFSKAAGKEPAVELFELFADKLTEAGISIKKGYFGEHMEIHVSLNGPVTIILDSEKI